MHNNVEHLSKSFTIPLSKVYVLRLHPQNMIHFVYSTMYDPLHYPTVPTITTARKLPDMRLILLFRKRLLWVFSGWSKSNASTLFCH